MAYGLDLCHTEWLPGVGLWPRSMSYRMVAWCRPMAYGLDLCHTEWLPGVGLWPRSMSYRMVAWCRPMV